MKYCNICKELKYDNEFSNRSDTNDGLEYKCRDCCRVYKMAYGKENRKRITEQQTEYQKKRDHSDPNFRMKRCMSSRLSLFKHSETLEKYRDCTDDYFSKWLEYQFTDGMSFDNYGSVWEIDHVLPVSFFNHENEEEIYVCWNWKNLRPLTVSDNRSKKDSVDFTLYQNQLDKASQFQSLINQPIQPIYQPIHQQINQFIQPIYQPINQPIQPMCQPINQPIYQQINQFIDQNGHQPI